MSLNDRERQVLKELEDAPLGSLSTRNRELMTQLRRQAVLGDDDVAQGDGSVGSMIDIGEGRVQPKKAQVPPRPTGLTLPCPNCGTEIKGIRGVGAKYYACLCGRKWTGPSSTRISSIDPADPGNQPPYERMPGMPEDATSFAGSAQRFRILSRRVDTDD